MRSFSILACAAFLTACGSSGGPGPVRYANQEPVTSVNDRRNIEKPRETKFLKALYHFDGFFHDPLVGLTEVKAARPAANVNSMGEVPDSTWFQNRIGVRDLSVEEMRLGPGTGESSEDKKPWTIVSSKVGGVSPGFIIKDIEGQRYLLKFDEKQFPEMETGTDVIIQRILWACGYNVPEDEVVYFRREDLVVAPDAVSKDLFGDEKPLTREAVMRELDDVNNGVDGTIRGLTSKFVSGVPLGGWPREGVREDDPNDRVPHELRRDLRGQRAFFSWLDHTDIKEDNTLDMWQEDPENPDHHYVVHYLIDFGKALGVQGAIAGLEASGYQHLIDFSNLGKSLITGGLYRRPWENRPIPEFVGVGFFDAEIYNPDDWKAHTPGYYPIQNADRFDQFWASKILIRFTEEQLRVAVEAAKFSDPLASAYVLRTLRARQRQTARHWFERVNPVDEFSLERRGAAYRLCFTDLTVHHNLERSLVAKTAYALRIYDRGGAEIDRRRISGTLYGRICADGIEPAPGPEGYTIVRIDTEREMLDVPPALLHLAADQAGMLRIIGLRRQ